MFWLLLLITFIALIAVMRKEAGAIAAVAVFAAMGLASSAVGYKLLGFMLYAGAIVTALTGLMPLRRLWLSPRIFAMFKRIAPKVSATEQVALDAGTPLDSLSHNSRRTTCTFVRYQLRTMHAIEMAIGWFLNTGERSLIQ